MKNLNIKKISKIAPIAVALSMSFLATPTQSFADENSPTLQVAQEASLQEGLSGYYYYMGYGDWTWSWIPIQENYLTGDLSSLPTEADGQWKRAAFWAGKIQVDETGEYSFAPETSGKAYTRISIDGKFLNNGQKITLEKNKLYDISIDTQNIADGEKLGLKLYWVTPKNQKEIIPAKHFFSPNVPKQSKSSYEGPSIRSNC
ncbi:PA14 domain-containing protein [Bacillus cereus]|uniref:PA14 domain-containing protein n=1 Tax=Bacillus cereus TaxID=1396 RepID=UPI0011A161AF|nr:PA14 domain-containing protein [Bacillus cereus]